MKDKNQVVFVKEGYNSAFATRRLGAVVKGTSADWQVSEIYTSSDAASFSSSVSSSWSSLGATLLPSSADDELVNQFFASVVTVTKTPKGGWKKIAPALKKNIETDERVSYSDPNKHFREMLITHGAYAYKKGSIPVDRNVLEFSLYRENTPLRAIMRRVAKKLRVQDEKLAKIHGEDFFVVSMKESYGCVNQLGRIRNVSVEMLPHASRHYNINPILFNPLKYLPSENTMMRDNQTNENDNDQPVVLLTSKFRGNRWRVMLRCVDGSKAEIEDTLSRLSQKGAINYFPLRNLGGGAAGGSATDINAAVAEGRYFDACRFWLQNEGSRDFLFKSHYSSYLAADSGSVGGIMEIASKELADAKASPYLVQATKFLAEKHNNTNKSSSNNNNSSSSILSDEICKQLWEQTVSEAVDPIAIREAPDNFLWNLAVSQRMYKAGTDKVVKGDYVVVADHKDAAATAGASHHGQGGGVGMSSMKVKRIESDEEGRAYSVERDLVVPFASNYFLSTKNGTTSTAESSSTSSNCCWYEEFYKSAAEQFGLSRACFESSSSSSSSSNPRHRENQSLKFRRAILKPTSAMQAVIVEDPNSLSMLKTDLFLRQERKNANGDITLEGRFRTPTLFNVSDAFRELMQDAIHNPPPSSSSSVSVSSSSSSNSRCSVAIEVDLPVGAHVLSFLREAFLVRHIHYTDQLDIVSGY